jgi:hypothetical protein
MMMGLVHPVGLYKTSVEKYEDLCEAEGQPRSISQ